MLAYNASRTKIATHSDASYYSEPQIRNRAYGRLFPPGNLSVPHNNGAVLNLVHIIKHVIFSATAAELAAPHLIAREAVYSCIILEEMGHK